VSIVAFGFFCFAALTLLLYYCCPVRLRWYVPLAASVAFYIIGGGWVLFLGMCAMATTAYFGALFAERDGGGWRGWAPIAAIVLLAGALIAFKENQFFVDNGNWLLGFTNRKFRMTLPSWVAPIGISYWTLMLLGYVLDVKWGKYSAETDPLKVLLFTCYFPQMTLGPFTRFDDMRDKLFVGHRFDYDGFCQGLQRVGWGLFKKLVLAERLALIVSTVYGSKSDGGGYQGLVIVFGAICYVLQLYTDFSGAIDIVNGISQMFGITLPENFQQPFFSLSLSEIWRRWHMTLGFWMRDYIMYPVQRTLTVRYAKAARRRFGKKRGKNILLYISMLATWFTVGFWHGGSWKYICASGLFFFIMIVAGMLLQPFFDLLKDTLNVDTDSFSWRLWSRARSFLLFALSVSFGRAADLASGFTFWRKAFHWNPWVLFDGTMFKLGLDGKDFWVLMIGMIVLLLVSCSQVRRGSTRVWLTKQNIAFRWAMLMGLCFTVLILGMYGEGYNPADFIYGGF
jgi:D-alanyl-lipoteichoic acid acyltransferase DltB (MBOAT superfamily)